TLQCRNEGRFLEARTTAAITQEEALDRFRVRDKYATQKDDYLREKHREMVWRDVIKASLPLDLEGETDEAAQNKYRSHRGSVIRALRQIILDGDRSYGVFPDEPLQDKDGFFIVENVSIFIANNLEEIGELVMADNRHKILEHKRRET